MLFYAAFNIISALSLKQQSCLCISWILSVLPELPKDNPMENKLIQYD